jgi:hypothetical protein
VRALRQQSADAARALEHCQRAHIELQDMPGATPREFSSRFFSFRLVSFESFESLKKVELEALNDYVRFLRFCS